MKSSSASNFRSKASNVNIPGTNVSFANAQLLTSTGSSTLDFFLGGGLAIGTICAIELIYIIQPWPKVLGTLTFNTFLDFKCDDAIESLNQSRKHLSSMNISETLHKMTVLHGLLNLQVQESASDESDSGEEEPMEL